MLTITRTFSLDEGDLEETFVQSGGPGGQHANKVATAVQLRVSLDKVPVRLHARLRETAGHLVTKRGDLLIKANEHRSQEMNRESARERLVAVLREAAAPPPPKRRPTRPTKGSVKRRLDRKTQRGATKKLRGRVRGE